MESEAQAEIDSVKANLAAIQVLCQGFHHTASWPKPVASTASLCTA